MTFAKHYDLGWMKVYCDNYASYHVGETVWVDDNNPEAGHYYEEDFEEWTNEDRSQEIGES